MNTDSYRSRRLLRAPAKILGTATRAANPSRSAWRSPPPRTASRAASSGGPTRPRRNWKRPPGPEDHRQDRQQHARTGQPGAGPRGGQQDQRAGDPAAGIGLADAAGGAGEEQGRVRDRGRPRPDQPGAQNAYVAGDNTAFGRLPAEYLAKALNGKGNIVVLRGMPSTIDNERVDAFNAEIKSIPASRCSTPSTATGTATMPSRSCRIT
jgi:hypothetical protein